MQDRETLDCVHAPGRLSRRDLLGRALAVGLAATAARPSRAAEEEADAPRSGGTSRLGLGGGGTTDMLNPLTLTGSIKIDVGFALLNTLVENSATDRPIPAESYEPDDETKVWTFILRRGVHFHNGKEIDPGDALFSLNLHRKTAPAGAAGLLSGVSAARAFGKYPMSDARLGQRRLSHRTDRLSRHDGPGRFCRLGAPDRHGRFHRRPLRAGQPHLLKKAGTYWKPDLRATIAGAQAMLTEHASTLIPCFRDCLDARPIQGRRPHAPQRLDMDNGNIAEKVFLKA